MEIENIKTPKAPQTGGFKRTTMYDLSKADYEKFLKQVEKSDLKNSSSRYLNELQMLENMLRYAKSYSTEEEIQAVETKIEDTRKILKEQFGIKVK